MNFELKKAIFEKGITQRAFSQQSGIPEVAISNAIRGVRELSRGDQLRAAELLGWDVDDLFSEGD